MKKLGVQVPALYHHISNPFLELSESSDSTEGEVDSSEDALIRCHRHRERCGSTSSRQVN